MRILKLFLQIFLSSLIIFFIVYWFFRIYLFNINWEFIYLLKNITPEKINNNIIVVEIDDLTYNKLWFPIDRGDYIPFLDNINKAKPAVIWFDILFSDKWKDINIDRKLINKFNESKNIITWFDIRNKEAILPYELIKNSSKNIWYLKPIVNWENWKVYSIKPITDLYVNGRRKIFESFSFTVLREYYNYIYLKEDYSLIKPNFYEKTYNFFFKKVPLIDENFYILYSKPANFQRESYYNIYTWNFNKDKFKDKIVLVWYTAQWVKDDFFVPGLKNWWVLKWVYIHANTINNILNDNYVIFFNKKIELFIWFIFIMLVLYFNVIYNKNLNLRWVFLWWFSLFLFIFVLYIIIFTLLFKSSWIFFVPNYPAEFISILFLSFFISSILKYINEDKNKRMLSKALSEYVSSDITKEILYSKWEVNLSWENKKITIFFSDIAWFTTISEKLSPEQLVSFLRVYLWEMSNIIMDKKWFINKYEWDAIMALWWVFWEVENYWIMDACESCLLQQEKLSNLNKKWKDEWKNELFVRMWLHTGNAIIWNIWSEGRKMEFTALWDSVNLASRLEGVNKAYNTNICCSEDIYLEASEKYFFRYLDKIRVKWKNKWVKIYELMWRIWEMDDYKLDIVRDFNEWILSYIKRDFHKSREIFEKLSVIDNPSKIYLQRCEDYILNPPNEYWDGIYVMKTK